ncbi:MAG: hypothetical protein KAI61_02545 [Alphaproteobacteria bacterium]|nr:hypothetical protein [Alphaproteobacteria bacterium]
MQKENIKITPKENQKPPLSLQVQETLIVISAFSNLLVKETKALKKANFKTIKTLQADKKLLAKQYHANITALSARREELQELDLALREKLNKERASFSVILEENLQALDLAQNSTKRLVNRILEAARHAVTEERQTNYSNDGKAMAYKSASLSLSVDQSL